MGNARPPFGRNLPLSTTDAIEQGMARTVNPALMDFGKLTVSGSDGTGDHSELFRFKSVD
ncbi:MAG: hypothetical protein H8E37_10480 [Planctomycetes bacterium]|nr:hypothetical protein [Planctomycetota bacterium]